MATAPSKSVALNIGAFLVHNNVRRNISSLAYNFSSPTANVITNNLSLNIGDTLTFNTPMSVSSFTLVSSTSPLDVDFTLDASAPTPSYSLSLNRVHLVDSDVRQIVLTNNGSSVANVILIQA